MALACGSAEEAQRVQLLVQAQPLASGAFATDLGYEITLDGAQLALRDIEFTVAGEAHAGLAERLRAFFRPIAHAHPGHFQGGEVTGELLGSYVVDWTPGASQRLGEATLLEGDYSAANFTFERAPDHGSHDGVAFDDALHGHTAMLSGRAELGGATYPFVIVVDAPEARVLVGVRCQHVVRASDGDAPSLALSLRPVNDAGETLLDGVDFAALQGAAGGDQGVIVVMPPDARDADLDGFDGAYNLVRRRLLTHDHYEFGAMEAPRGAIR